jgi:hypothetical protein
MLPLLSNPVNPLISDRQFSRAATPNKTRLGEPYKFTNPASACQARFVPSWNLFGCREAHTRRRRKRSNRAGATSHRRSGGPHPRQKGNILRREIPVNPPHDHWGIAPPAYLAIWNGRRPAGLRRDGRIHRSHDRQIQRSADLQCRTRTTCRLLCPLRSTNNRPSIA